MAVLSVPLQRGTAIKSSDLEWEFFRSGGPGGQHQNTSDSGARVRHRPTGLVVESRTEREQPRNKAKCYEKLKKLLASSAAAEASKKANAKRKSQIGSGMRGDKIMTYRSQDDTVTDHRTKKKTRLSLVMKGDFGRLFRV